MRLTRWLRYEQTQRWAIQILIYRSQTIRQGVEDMRRYMAEIGLTETEARQLWDRASENGVAHMEREWRD